MLIKRGKIEIVSIIKEESLDKEPSDDKNSNFVQMYESLKKKEASTKGDKK